MSLSLSESTLRSLAVGVAAAVSSAFTTIGERLAQLGRLMDRLDVAFVDIVRTVAGVRIAALRTWESNPSLLENVEATRWAVAYFSYNKFLDALTALWSIRARLDRIVDAVAPLHLDLVGIAYEITALGSQVVTLLGAILDELRKGLRVSGTVLVFGVISVTGGGGGGGGLGNLLTWGDILKLLAVLTILAAFVAALGVALSTFTPVAIAAIAAVAGFMYVMVPLLEQLGKMPIEDVGTMALALTALATFVGLLGAALALFSARAILAAGAVALFMTVMVPLMEQLGRMPVADVGTMALALTSLATFVGLLGAALALFSARAMLAAGAVAVFMTVMVPLMEQLGRMPVADVGTMALALTSLAAFVGLLGAALATLSWKAMAAMAAIALFMGAMVPLMEKLGKMPIADVGTMALALLSLAAFVGLLGYAFQQFSLKAIPIMLVLPDFMDRLAEMGIKLGALPIEDVLGMGLALGLLAGFVYLLALALGQLSPGMEEILPKLTEFIGALGKLGTDLAGLSGMDLFGMAMGLAALAGFVYLLALGINTLTVDSANALPALTALIGALGGLAGTLAPLSGGQLVAMALGLAMLAAFVWAVGAALNFAVPGLNALSGVLAQLQGSLGAVASAARGVASALGSLPSLGSFSLPSFSGGGIMPHDGLAMLHAGELVLTPEEAAAYQGGVATPGTAPPLPEALAGGGAGAAGVDQSVNLTGLTINITAERLDADAGRLLSDEIVARLQERLGALRSEQAFRTGTRAAAPA